jgi:hypothetical protein
VSVICGDTLLRDLLEILRVLFHPVFAIQSRTFRSDSSIGP